MASPVPDGGAKAFYGIGSGRVTAARSDLPQQIPREVVAVLPRQLGALPVLPGDDTAAARGPAAAGHRLGAVVDGRVIEGQLLSRGHVAQRHEDDLPLDADVGLT